jgi:hypothetical protein
MANSEHLQTLSALFQLSGFTEEGAKEISDILYYIDNGVQDRLIRAMTDALLKKQAAK